MARRPTKVYIGKRVAPGPVKRAVRSVNRQAGKRVIKVTGNPKAADTTVRRVGKPVLEHTKKWPQREDPVTWVSSGKKQVRLNPRLTPRRQATVMVHELGHVRGARHHTGGVMGANTGSRKFTERGVKQVRKGRTTKKQITRQSKRLGRIR